MRDKRNKKHLEEFIVHFCKPTVKPRELPMVNFVPAIGLIGVLIVGMLLTLGVSALSAAPHGTAEAIVLSTALIEKRNTLESKRAALGKVFEEAGSTLDFSKVKCLGDNMTDIAKLEKVREMDTELNTLNDEFTKMAAVEQAQVNLKRYETGGSAGAPVHSVKGTEGREGTEEKTFGQLFMESDAYKQRNDMKRAVIQGEIKTLFATNAGWSPQSLRTGRVVDFATRPIQLIDIMPMETTGFQAVKYMEETTFTNAAVETAEGGAFPELAFALTERSVPVQKIPAFLPVSDEQLDDEPRVQAYIDNRIRFVLNQRLDLQILQGDGNSPNLTGILNKAGIQTQAKGADPVPDAIRKAMTKIRVTGEAVPNVVVLHPNDWQDIRLLRTSMGDYIWGNPAESGPQRIWGLPVAEAQAATENTGVVGDFANFSALVTRKDIDVQVGYINDDFQKGRKSIRADMRVALVWYRAAAFCTVTGI